MRLGKVTWVVVVLLAAASMAVAQTGSEDDYYLSDQVDSEGPRFAVGLGFGFIEIGDNVIGLIGDRGVLVVEDDVEPYYTVNFRIRFGDRRAYGGGRGFQGYLEPELAYWETDAAAGSVSDLLLGLNIIGAVPLSAVEFFAGAGLGIHFVDRQISDPFTNLDDSDEALGANVQFGLDLAVSERVSLFGVGRFDIVDDDRDELEGKAYVGVRFRF